MSELDWLAVALIALTLAFPAGVKFGIEIGRMRERDSQREKERRQAEMYWQMTSYMPEGTEPKTIRPR